MGRRHPGDRHVRRNVDARPLQPLRHRPVGAADPPLLARPGRERLPGRRDRVPHDAPGRVARSPRMYIDGEVYLADGGHRRAIRPAAGAAAGARRRRGDALLRPTADATGSSTRRAPAARGPSTAYDRGNARLIAFDKPTGTYRRPVPDRGGGHRLGGPPRLLRRDPGHGQAPLLFWIERTAIGCRASRTARTAVRRPAPSASPGASAAPPPRRRSPRRSRREAHAEPRRRRRTQRAGRPPARRRRAAWDNRRHGRAPDRDGRRERAGPHALDPARRDPQGARARALPAHLDRAVGGERDRHEAPGAHARSGRSPTTCSPPSSRSSARPSARSSSPTSPTRRSTPGSCWSPAAGSSRSTRGRPTRSRSRSGPGVRDLRRGGGPGAGRAWSRERGRRREDADDERSRSSATS